MRLRGTIVALFLLIFSFSYSQTVNDISKIILCVRFQDNKQQERELEGYKKETAHKRNIENRNMDLKELLIESAERVAHDQISKEKQAITASERVAYYKANVDAEKVEALKTNACEYIRNNPNHYYN